MDFNADTIATAVPKNILHILILQRQSDVIEAIELYNKAKFQEQHPPALWATVKARFKSFFYQIEGAVYRDDSFLKKENIKTFEGLKKQIDELKEDNFEEVLLTLNRWLDVKGITKVDTGVSYDPRKVEDENELRGLQ